MFGARSEGTPGNCYDESTGKDYKNHLYQSKYNKLLGKPYKTEHYECYLFYCHRCGIWIPDRNSYRQIEK